MIGNFYPLSSVQAEMLKANQEGVEEFIYSDEVQKSEALLDIDKAWHALHFILTGSAWESEHPLNIVVLGGEEIGKDAGYGPARLVSPDYVIEVNEALAGISTVDFESKFDAEKLNKEEIYPNGWSSEDVRYISSAFEEVKKLYKSASEEREYVLLFIN